MLQTAAAGAKFGVNEEAALEKFATLQERIALAQEVLNRHMEVYSFNIMFDAFPVLVRKIPCDENSSLTWISSHTTMKDKYTGKCVKDLATKH